MILTVDLNPTIDLEYTIDDFPQDGEIIAKSSSYDPGGKGITIAKLLNIFNEKSIITGFLGGVNGKIYHERLMEADILHKVISIKDETSSRVKIRNSQDRRLVISEEGPRIIRRNMIEFYKLYSELLEEIDLVIGGSSLPQGIDEDIYFDLIRLSNERGKTFILDGAGKGLSKSLDASPNIVIISKKQLEGLVNLNLNFEIEILRAAGYILDKGVKLLVINLQEKGSIVIEESVGYRLDFQNIYGDSWQGDNLGLIAGLALGISRNYDFEMTLRLSQAFSIAYTMGKDIGNLDMGEVKKIMNDVEVDPINY